MKDENVMMNANLMNALVQVLSYKPTGKLCFCLLFVCLFASSIAQKVMNRYAQNLWNFVLLPSNATNFSQQLSKRGLDSGLSQKVTYRNI